MNEKDTFLFVFFADHFSIDEQTTSPQAAMNKTRED